MLLRLIILGLFFYLVIKLFKSLFASLGGPKNTEKVHGSRSQGKPPLDLKNKDVEDADFEDIK